MRLETVKRETVQVINAINNLQKWVETYSLQEQSKGTKATDTNKPRDLKYMQRSWRGETQSGIEPDHTGFWRKQLQRETLLRTVFILLCLLSHSYFQGKDQWEFKKRVPLFQHCFPLPFLAYELLKYKKRNLSKTTKGTCLRYNSFNLQTLFPSLQYSYFKISTIPSFLLLLLSIFTILILILPSVYPILFSNICLYLLILVPTSQPETLFLTTPFSIFAHQLHSYLNLSIFGKDNL